MYNENLVQTGEIIRKIFDPRCDSRKCHIAPAVKYRYLQHFLAERWEEICGANLARSCSVYKLEGSSLYVRTASSLLANELYMMKNLFLQKVNGYLLGRVIVRDIHFVSGGQIRKAEKKQRAEAAEPERKYAVCPRCGARMDAELKICTACSREEKEKLKAEIAELLRIQPWITYENCLNYYQCDKILFTAVKDSLKNTYYERVRLGHASGKDSLMAVLLLTGRQPDELDERTYNNALEYLRRDHSVPASWSRLYGKKQ